jgi:phosphate transport system substrate-binding protein
MLRNAVWAAAAALGLCGALAGCAERAPVQQVRVDGSSTVFPVSERIAEAFQLRYGRRVRVPLGEAGTGGGFAKFCRGEADIVGASRPIELDEMEACAEAGIGFVEVPIVFDGITIVVNQDNPVTSMTVDQLRRMWEPAAERTVRNWRDIDPSFPDLPLSLFGPGTASGTFDFFTAAITGEEGASRADFTPTEDDNVIVQGVSTSAGGLGYFGVAYYQANRDRLNAVSVDNGAGPIEPTLENVGSGVYQPLSRPLFIYVSARSLERTAVRQFALFYLSQVREEANAVGYVPLPDESYAVYADRIRNVATGTVFNGEGAVGVTIEELKRRPLQNEAGAAPEPTPPVLPPAATGQGG